MSGRFPETERLTNGGPPPPTPDSTLSCSLCHAPLQDGRVLPNCLHSFCRSCLEQHALGPGGHIAACPLPSCGKPVNAKLEELSSTPYSGLFHDLADTTDPGPVPVPSVTLPEFEKLSLAAASGPRFAPGPVGSSRHSPSGLHAAAPRPSFEADNWRSGTNFINPLTQPSFNNLLGDSWKPISVSEPWGGPAINPNGGPLANLGSSNNTTAGPTNMAAVKQRTSPASASVSVPASGLQKSHVCKNLKECQEAGSLVTSRCRDCDEDLCEACVRAHKTVKQTRDHAIVRYPETRQQPMRQHDAAPAIADQDMVRVFQETVDEAKKKNRDNILRAEKGYMECQQALDKMSKRNMQIGVVVNQVSQEIRAHTERTVLAVQQREAMLLQRLNKIREVKMEALADQERQIRNAMFRLENVVQVLQRCKNDNGAAIIDTNKAAEQNIRAAQVTAGALEPSEDAVVTFHPPEAGLVQTLAGAGAVTTSGFAPLSTAEGDGLSKGVLGREAKFCVLVKDHVGDNYSLQADTLSVLIKSPDNRQVWWEKIPDASTPGRFMVRWRPHDIGEHQLEVTLHGRHIEHSPFKCLVKAGRDYNSVGSPVLEFSQEGSGDGDLCRPWGICCTPKGLIVVADRSNNRICVFNRDGSFHSKFGTEGTRKGQFNRPASVVMDSMNRLVVTDKDNHRMQIFTMEGEFLLMFGEKGAANGQFMYPWDVACNSKNQILVSDTRNHRLQLFSPAGEFLAKYGFDGQMWKHFDSPRGVCFTQDDQAIVTDFNNHRLLVIKDNFCSAQFLGCEGTKDGEFTRPNGVTVDDEGNIIVADSRNNRIQVFSSSGVFMKKFGTNGSSSGELDRPCGICMTPDGLIAVVDFGNTRVSLF